MRTKIILAALSIAAAASMSSCAAWDDGYATNVMTVYHPPLVPPAGYYGVHLTPPMLGYPSVPTPPHYAPGINRPVTQPDTRPVTKPSVRPGQGSGVHNSTAGQGSSTRPGARTTGTD